MCQTKHRSEFINPNTLNPMWSHGYFCWSHFVAIHVGCLPNRFTVIRMPSSTTSRGQPFHLSNPGAEVLFELICWSLKFLIQEDAADVQVLNAHSNQIFLGWFLKRQPPLQILGTGILNVASLWTIYTQTSNVASFSDFAIFCGVFQDWQQEIMREFAFGPDPGLLLILLKAPRRYAPEHFAFLTQVAADANGGVSTGFNWERGWEHGWAWCEVPWSTLVVALRFGCVLKGSVNGKG